MMSVSRILSRVGTRHISTNCVAYERLGNPLDVLQAKELDVGNDLKGEEVLVKMVAAPVTAFDVNAVAGAVGGVGSSGIAGNDGVGIVENVGSSVKGLKKGDHVIAAKPGVGTWSGFTVAKSSDLLAVPSDIDIEQAALLGTSGATALRVLNDFGSLKSGDTIIHNAANGSYGMAIVQIAKSKGLQVISVCDDGCTGYEDVASQLQKAGSHVVIHETFGNSDSFKKVCAELKPKLAIHCSQSSRDSTIVARGLAPGGTLVSVCGAGPVNVPSSLLIDRGVSIQGFNLLQSLSKESASKETLDELVQLVKGGQLSQVVTAKTDLSDFKALVSSPSSNGNVLLTF